MTLRMRPAPYSSAALIDDTRPHAFWDNTLEPRARVASGDTVVFETLEGTGQVTPATTSDTLAALRSDLIHPLTGPVEISGAEPGDALEVDVLSLAHQGWGWNGVIPGFGLLAADFAKPYIHHYKLVRNTCIFNESIRLPYRPFCGVMGVAPSEEGRLNTAPPRRNGGNIDIRHLTPGARLFLPVLVSGARFSCGDCHATQGDGEVNGTGVESPMSVALRFIVHKDAAPKELHFITPPTERIVEPNRGTYVTTAHGSDLFSNAQQAIRYMIDYLTDQHALTPEQAYCLCGATVDLHISEIVNEPNWIVSAHLPLGIFRRHRLSRRRDAQANA
jgi:acetamidase/formamidase